MRTRVDEIAPHPVHARWLNQIATYFGIVQRKVLTPSDVSSLSAVTDRPRSFEVYAIG